MCKCSLSSIDLLLIFFEIVEVLLNRFEIMVEILCDVKRKLFSGAREEESFLDSIDSFLDSIDVVRQGGFWNF